MADFNRLIGQLLGSGAAGGFAGGLAGGLASGMLTSKEGRKLGKKTLKMGGVAAVGALAYAAYQRYSAGQQSPPIESSSLPQAPPAREVEGTAFLPPENDTAGRDALGLTLVRAMIAAARADGTLDAQESQAIFQRIQALGLNADDQALLVAEMGRPVDMDALVSRADSIEVAAEIYLASLLAIDPDTAAEKAYLTMLAARLNLPADLVNELHRQVEEQSAA
ncbi:MAG: tellurite resistance TerB family protein [Desulfofustis sp. PB-SRB1]|jgi:uncharacterized membrane protein YebE (DUF533 family)|nr:tellurite resistance TerB family protein [Desulfofustis sp. PB-SRB1]MBM1003683.1 tellurite resistance TerB family protein [Desulfofustis sp. PB-SRB1]HBH29934.1 DUF533 domain-containing protein [Desulfofustis sp.]